MKNLENELKELVAQEREILHEILLRIRALDENRFYLERGYPSLFEYLTREIGYSQGAAQRRIDAARLSREVPEVIDRVRTGELSLFQIAEAQKGFRRAGVTVEEKRGLLEKIIAAAAGDAPKIVAEELDLPVAKRPQARAQSDGSVRLALTLSPEAVRDLSKVKELLSHSIPNGDPGLILEKLLHLYLSKPEPTATVAVNHRQKTIPAATRRQIFARDQVCQFRSSDGRLCGSRHQLQTDHRQMRFHGGTHEPENLRLLCAQHNRYLAEKGMRGEPTD